MEMVELADFINRKRFEGWSDTAILDRIRDDWGRPSDPPGLP